MLIRFVSKHRVNRPRLRAAAGLALLLAGPAMAGETAPTSTVATVTVRDRHRAEVQQIFAADRARTAGDANWFVRFGVLANRTARWVRVYGETVGLNDFITPQVEFPLIAEPSGKDYEALALALAKPSDIHAALVFIGLTPGRPIDYTVNRIWPRGPRVRLTFEWTPSNSPACTVAPEALILDTRTGKPLPSQGFVFVGSRWLADPHNPTARVYAADTYDPMVIASVYNEGDSVLDVPRCALKSDAYNVQVRNPAVPVPKAELIRIRLEPASDREPRGVDLRLHIAPAASNAAPSRLNLAYTLTDAQGRPAATGAALANVLAAFERLAADGREPFVTLEPDDTLTLAALRDVYAFMATIESDTGIRIEPPPAGHPYYRAFLPEERLRERPNRPIQPLELVCTPVREAVTGELIRVEDIWEEDATNAVYRETRFPVGSVAQLGELLNTHRDPYVLLVFAPGSVRYGALRPYLQQGLLTHQALYVFLVPERPAGAATAPNRCVCPE